MIFPTHDQSTKIAPPREGAFDRPSPLVATQWTAILGGWFFSILAMRTNQFDASSRQSGTQRIRIGGFIVDQPLRIFPRPTPPRSRHAHPFQRWLNQGDFRRGRRFQVVSQRNTLAVDHHHPLRTLSTFGFADTGPPFFAGAKLPSAKVSAQSSWPRSSSCLSSASRYWGRDTDPADLSNGPHCVTPTRSLQKRADWESVWAPLSARLSLRVVTGRYTPIVHRLIRIRVVTWKVSFRRTNIHKSESEKNLNHSQVMKLLLV